MLAVLGGNNDVVFTGRNVLQYLPASYLLKVAAQHRSDVALCGVESVR